MFICLLLRSKPTRGWIEIIRDTSLKYHPEQSCAFPEAGLLFHSIVPNVNWDKSEQISLQFLPFLINSFIQILEKVFFFLRTVFYRSNGS